MYKIIFIAFLLSACSDTVKFENTDDIISGIPVKLIVLDSCEYLLHGECFTHKGNCKKCAKDEVKRMQCVLSSDQTDFSCDSCSKIYNK